MTHEEKLRALLPNPKEYVEDYELRGDNGDYTPNKNEQFLMKDCLIGYEEECFNALKDKVVMREELLTKNELNNILWGANNEWYNTHSENADGYIRFLAQCIFEAQNKKAGLV